MDTSVGATADYNLGDLVLVKATDGRPWPAKITTCRSKVEKFRGKWRIEDVAYRKSKASDVKFSPTPHPVEFFCCCVLKTECVKWIQADGLDPFAPELISGVTLDPKSPDFEAHRAAYKEAMTIYKDAKKKARAILRRTARQFALTAQSDLSHDVPKTLVNASHMIEQLTGRSVRRPGRARTTLTSDDEDASNPVSAPRSSLARGVAQDTVGATPEHDHLGPFSRKPPAPILDELHDAFRERAETAKVIPQNAGKANGGSHCPKAVEDEVDGNRNHAGQVADGHDDTPQTAHFSSNPSPLQSADVQLRCEPADGGASNATHNAAADLNHAAPIQGLLPGFGRLRTKRTSEGCEGASSHDRQKHPATKEKETIGKSAEANVEAPPANELNVNPDVSVAKQSMGGNSGNEASRRNRAEEQEGNVARTSSQVGSQANGGNCTFQLGDLVFAKYKNNPYWPAVIERCNWRRSYWEWKKENPSRFFVRFVDEDTGAWVLSEDVELFKPDQIRRFKCPSIHLLYNDQEHAIEAAKVLYMQQLEVEHQEKGGGEAENTDGAATAVVKKKPDFKVGDLVMAQVRGHSFWPATVAQCWWRNEEYHLKCKIEERRDSGATSVWITRETGSNTREFSRLTRRARCNLSAKRTLNRRFFPRLPR